MDLSYIATWYIIGFFIVIIYIMLFDSKDVDEINRDFTVMIKCAMFSWLAIVLEIFVTTDNKK